MGWRFYTLSAAGNPRMVSAQGTRAHRLEKETTRMHVRLIWEKVESSGVSLHPSCFPVLYVNARLLFPTGTSGPTTSCLTLFIALFALLEIKSKLYPSGSQSPISLCLYFFAFIAWLHQCGVVQSAESEGAQSCLTVTPWAVAYQAPLSMEFSRQEYWSGLPFPSPGDLLDPGIEPRSPALQAGTSLSEPRGKPCH